MKSQRTTALALTVIVTASGLVACSAGSSPKSTVTAMCSAAQNKDSKALKKTLSAYVLKNPGNEEYLTAFLNVPKVCTAPIETRGERLNGTQGSIDVSDQQGHWTTLQFVKEDDEWKFNWF